MSLKNQTSASSAPWKLLAIVAVIAAIAGCFYGYNPWLMVLAAVVALFICIILANLRDVFRYLHMRQM